MIAKNLGKARHTDAMRLEIFKNIFHSIAEEMGAALRRSAFSANIKERRDYSCAVYDGNGEVLAMGDHMPVHLGSMPASVAAARAALPFEPGDIALLNDPFAGGTHLPDLTLVMPVFVESQTKPQFFVASRAHHADIGGALAGSMGPAREIFQEGLRIPPVKIFRRGDIVRELLGLLLANVRTPWEREGDLAAQIASCRLGERRLRQVAAKYGLPEVQLYSEHLLDYSEKMMQSVIRSLRPGTYRAEDFLDGDGISHEPLRIRVSVRIKSNSAVVDFAGSAPQCAGNVSQGTMNNLTFGGIHPTRSELPFTYYETIAGGCGASSLGDGADATHSHLTNSWNTPVEVLEEAYPVRVKRYAIRSGSGGRGRNNGGDGIVRELEFLSRAEVGLLTDRRKTAPYGLHGGENGKPGINTLVQKGKGRPLAAKCSFVAKPGDLLRIETPGGGGWGQPRDKRQRRKK